MSCREDGRLSAWLDGELSPSEALEVEQHVATCGACGELASALRSFSFEAPAADPGFIVRFRERRDEVSVAPWWTWRQLALRLVPVATLVVVAALVALSLSTSSDATLEALEREALGTPVAVESGPETVLSIAFEPFPADIE